MVSGHFEKIAKGRRIGEEEEGTKAATRVVA
jgi:hypothetical protein